jgi:hypothetical protein
MRNSLVCLGLVIAAALAAVNPGFGDVTFTPYTIATGFDSPAGVYAADIDGDGDRDVVAAAANADEVSWWRNDGGDPVAWTKFVMADAFGGAVFVYAEDVDGDLRTDVLAAGWYRNQIAWWRNGGGDPITWTKQAIANNFLHAHEVYACDVDRDGDIDALGASAGSTIAWWRNDGGNPIVWTAQVLGSNANGARSVRAADLDHDLDIDVVGAALTDNEISWWRNDGGNPIQWTEIAITSTFGGAHMVRTCDLDSDGNVDIVAAGYTADEVAWWRNGGGNPVTWTKQTIALGFDGAVTVCPEDIDGDGDQDILGAAQDVNDLTWWSNDGGDPIVWTEHSIDDDFPGVWPAYAADLNGDAQMDVVAGGATADELRWWRNDALAGVSDPTDAATPRIGADRLYQNSPNPFCATTAIRYDLSRASTVYLAIYDVRGKLVRALLDGAQEAGSQRVAWDGLDAQGRAAAPGLYFCRISAGGFQATRPILLVR